jgi:MOSC domain-containing protein YiiM
LVIDSNSMGNPAKFRTLDSLEATLDALPPSPRDSGRVAMIVRRADGGRRETPDRVSMTPESGLPGDAWGRMREPMLEAQLAVMQIDVAESIANGQPLTLFGDNLFLELDLSTTNLPPGSRLRAGSIILEVTAQPHNGCRKFRGRFGEDALRFVSKRELRHLNLRGIYMRVVEGGTISLGDTVEVISRAGSAAAPGR